MSIDVWTEFLFLKVCFNFPIERSFEVGTIAGKGGRVLRISTVIKN